MDNNLNGIPSVDDVKVEDTPAESFDNLYGNGEKSNVEIQPNTAPNNVGIQSQNINNVSQVGQNVQQAFTQANNSIPVMSVNNAGMNTTAEPNTSVVNNNASVNVNSSPIQQTPMQTNNTTPIMNTNNASVNPTVVPNIVNETVTPQVMPNNMEQQNAMNNIGTTQPQITNNIGPQPNMQINKGINQSNMQPNNNVASNPNVQPIMTPNPVNVTSNGVDISNMDIDNQRMQSIEEQLSKTSQYNPEDLQQEKITIPSDNQYEKNKSGLAFVIVLFVILAVVIALLPQITKWLT